MSHAWARAGVCYLVGTVVVLLGVSVGDRTLPPVADARPPGLVGAFPKPLDVLTSWDGQWYLRIAERGYWYERGQASAVAFFPTYPLAIRGLCALTRLPSHWIGLVISHGSLWLALAVFGRYLAERLRDGSRDMAFALWALALFPTAFFMRMVYSESFFLLLCVTLFLGMQQRWPSWLLGVLVGTITATRPVGAVALAPLCVHVWGQAPTHGAAVRRLLVVGALGIWGLAAFVAYQWAAFGEPLAFVKTQHFWRLRPTLSAGQLLLALASWEPIWSVYVAGLPGYWRSIDPGVPLVFSYQSANCVLFVAAAILLGVGWWKAWLNRPELAFGVSHLAFTYTMAGYRFCMLSQGRFVSVVFPIYIVLGMILARLPRWAAVCVLVLFAFYLAAFSAMLAAGYATV